MSLSDRLTSANTKGGSNQGLPCSVGELLRTLPKRQLDELREHLDAPWRVVPHEALERALIAEGHHVGVGAVGKHRRGDCRCRKVPK